MALYKTITGYGVDWRDEFGRRHRKFVGSQEAAAALERNLRETSSLGRTKLAAVTSTAGLTLQAAAALYVAHCGTAATSTKKKYKLLVELMARSTGNLQLAQITPALLTAYLEERATQLAPATLHLETSTLKNLFRFLTDQGHIALDPAKGIKSHRPTSKPVATITYEQERAILESFTERTQLKILLALDAGLRDGEITRLRRNHLDLENRTVLVHTSKPRTIPTRLIPLTGRLRTALTDRCQGLAPDSLLFVSATRQQTRASGFLYSAARRLPVKFTLHQLRHTFATRLAAVSANPFVVAAALGHKPFQLAWRGAQFRLTTPLYVHPTQEEIAQAIHQMEANNPNARPALRDEEKENHARTTLHLPHDPRPLQRFTHENTGTHPNLTRMGVGASSGRHQPRRQKPTHRAQRPPGHPAKNHTANHQELTTIAERSSLPTRQPPPGRGAGLHPRKRFERPWPHRRRLKNMELTASLTIEGLDEVDRLLTQALTEATQQAIREAFQRGRTAAAQQFATQGTAYDSPWTPRKKETRQTRGHPILVQSGNLRQSLTQQHHPLHLEQILAGPGSELTGIFGTRVSYAAFHQFGTRHLPARTILTPEMLTR